MVNEEELRCCMCGVPTEAILVDEHDKPPLQFCSWEHLQQLTNGKIPLTDTTGVSYTLTEVLWQMK